MISTASDTNSLAISAKHLSISSKASGESPSARKRSRHSDYASSNSKVAPRQHST